MEVSRRTALVALSTLAVAGCGVRLDVPPPEPPPPPDDPAGPDLLQERARAAAALMVANGVDAPLARALRPVHAEQVALLEEALTRLVPPPATP
ncbi:MAG: hypothetical protein Q4G34_06015, partial [Micrococcus sp.]|nr:hypothetical protein [Micrococcus sp.]